MTTEEVWLVGIVAGLIALLALLFFLHFNRRTAKIETKLGSISFGEEAQAKLDSVQNTVGGVYAAINGVTPDDTETLRQLMKRSITLSEATQAKVDGIGQTVSNLEGRFAEHLAFHAGAEAVKAAGKPAPRKRTPASS